MFLFYCTYFELYLGIFIHTMDNRLHLIDHMLAYLANKNKTLNIWQFKYLGILHVIFISALYKTINMSQFQIMKHLEYFTLLIHLFKR